MQYDITDPDLAHIGRRRVEWAEQEMPVMREIRRSFGEEFLLRGHVIAACLHVTTETANLLMTLKAGGAEVYCCGANPISTQDDVAAFLAIQAGIPTFAKRGEDKEVLDKHIDAVLDKNPTIILDDDGNLINALHTRHKDKMPRIIGGTEETMNGVVQLHNLDSENQLDIPMITINNAHTKNLFDNRYGTGQSVIDGLIRATNRLLASRNFVIAGYGWCGRGVAMRAAGMGAQVIICEVDPLRALEAMMDGFRVMSHMEAAKVGHFFCTVTGNIKVFRKEHFEVMMDGAIMCNAGHRHAEIDVDTLEKMSIAHREVRPMVTEHILSSGKRLYMVAKGRLVNLAMAEGHPAAVMDMTFSNQALVVEYLLSESGTLMPGVYPVPRFIESQIARMKLEAADINIDCMTQEQMDYLTSWYQGRKGF